MRRTILVVLSLLCGMVALNGPDARAASQSYGDLSFPADEHAHLVGLDYWWGAAEVVTTRGNQYTVSLAYTSFAGVIASGHQITPHQGPYDGQMLLTEQGPAEWGHPGAGQLLSTASVYAPGVTELVRLQTIDTTNGAAVDTFERTTLDDWLYRFRIDHAQAEVHPAGERIEMHVDLVIDMRDGAPLLAGGRGTWIYGTADYLGGYPSRSFQYSQAAQTLRGSISIEQPDGAVLVEQVDPARSSMVLVHEYDATPEDIPIGLALTTATQVHHRFVQEYQGGIPWELMYFDIGNGAQLQLLIQAYKDTEDGTIRNGLGLFSVPTYRVMGTVRLPNGKSAQVDDRLLVEHLEYREIVGRVPTTFVAITGQWTQAWRFRVGFPGRTATAGDGTTVDIPPFDLGIEPYAHRDNHFVDANGDGLNQRVGLRIFGHWGGCPVDGTGWSELIVNWTGQTHKDPWFTGREVPDVPARCRNNAIVGTHDGNGKPLTPPRENPPLPDLTTPPEGCSAGLGQPDCTFTASHEGAVGGYASQPGGWTVTIERAGRDPIIVRGFTGTTTYGCGIIRPGDVVHAEARDGSYVSAGNPIICS